MNAACTSRTILIYNDGEGWITRCTEFDANGDKIIGRVAMDEALNATTVREAQIEAARHWNCDVDEVERYDGPV